jgi:hypothetical protein
MNVDVAEWSRDVSSGDERDESDNKQGGRGEKERTFDGNELDGDDAKTEAGVCTRLELHLSSDGIACDVELVGKGDGELDL